MCAIWLSRHYCSWLPILIWLIHICVAWLIYVWNDSCIYEWHNSFIRVWHDSFTRVWYGLFTWKKHDPSTCVWLEWVDTTAATTTGVMSHSYMCAMTHSYGCDITWTMMVAWLIHDSFTHVGHDSRLMHVCVYEGSMTHSFVRMLTYWYTYDIYVSMWHDSSIYV